MKNNKPLKERGIFVGFNSAGAAGIYAFTRILKKEGYKIDFYGIGETYFKQPVDTLLVFPKNPFTSFVARWRYFFKILPEYDVWHFNFSQTFFFYPLNLLILKLCGKKIVATFRGADCETDLDFAKFNPIILAHPKEEWPSFFRNFHHLSWQGRLVKRVRTRIISWLADWPVVNAPYLASSVPGYKQIIPYARDLEKIEKFKTNQHNPKLTILHIPSQPEVKGTVYIKKAFDNLAPKYPNCDFKILDFMPYDQALQEMAQADIIIEQLIIGWYSGQSVEAMALGRAAMCFLEPTYMDLVPFGHDVPIANTNVFTFEEDLEKLINDPVRCQKLAAAGPAYVHAHHAAEKIAESYKKVYEEVWK